MTPAARRCAECDYAWNRYLRFSTCPRCGADVAGGVLKRESRRTRKLWQAAVVIGAAAWLLAIIDLIVRG